MMKNIINRLPIDTEVYQPNYGKGYVIDVFTDGYTIYFQNLDDNITFGLNGENMDEYPISLTKYDIINGGFTSILDYDKSTDDEVKTLTIFNDIHIEYIKWLEEQIEITLNNDLKREHWAYCQAYSKLLNFLNKK